MIWKSVPVLDNLNRMAEGTMSGLLGIRLTEVGDDYLRGTMPIDARTRQPFGVLHGGASVVLAETLGSMAAMCCVDSRSETVFGLDINANHMRAVSNGLVTGTARSLHIGRSTQVWEIRIEDDGGKLACSARLTIYVVQQPNLGV